MRRTGFESDFADHEPSCVEVQLCLDEASNVVGNRDDDVPSELDERVSHVVEHDSRLLAVDHSADAEPQNSSSKHPDVFAEHVVGVKPDRREVPHALELEENFDESTVAARPLCTVIAPTDPLIALVSPAVWIEPEVVMTLDAVCELAKSAAEVVVRDATVVREVVQVNLGASSLALRHVVRQHPICVSNIFSVTQTLRHHCYINTLRSTLFTKIVETHKRKRKKQ